MGWFEPDRARSVRAGCGMPGQVRSEFICSMQSHMELINRKHAV